MWIDKAWRSATFSLISLLTTIYFLTYSATPITDDEQLFVSAARNMVVRGTLRAEQMYGNLRLRGDFHGVEPAHPIVASLWLFMIKVGGIKGGNYQVLYFLPIFYTVSTGILLLALAKKLDFSLSAGFSIAIAYGLGTMAWPYTKSFLREPLLSMLVLAAWLAFLNFNNQNSFTSSLYKSMWVIFVILLAFVKIIYCSIGVAFLIILFLEKRKLMKGLANNRLKIVGLFFTMCMLIVYLFLTRNINDASIFYRFSGGVIHDALIHLVSAPHNHFIIAIIASLFSPFKGLLFYAPFTILGIISWFVNWRNYHRLFLLPLILLFSLLFFQAFVYDELWWTPTWGSRFLLPVVAPLLISSLPLVEKVLKKGKMGLFLLSSLFILGFLIQLPGVLFNSSKFFVLHYDSAEPVFSKTLWHILQAPYIVQWQVVISKDFDLLLWRVFFREPLIVISLLISASLLCLYVLRSLLLDFLSSFQNPKWLSWRVAFSSFFLSAIFLAVFYLGKNDPYYREFEFRSLCEYLAKHTNSMDLLIVYPYPGDLWDFFSNAECGQGVWYSLANGYFVNPDSEEYRMAEDLFQIAVDGSYPRVWIVSQDETQVLSGFDEMGSTPNFMELKDQGQFRQFVPIYFALYEIRK